MDLISVIVPIYNAQLYLERCVESIRSQTHSNLEIILVDDGSTDESPRMCDAYARRDPRIRVIHRTNAGAGVARNSGLEIAAGRYVTFVDADDWITEDRIGNLYREAKRTRAELVIGGHTSVARDGERGVNRVPLPVGAYTGDRIGLLLDLIAPAPENRRDVMLESAVWRNLYDRELILREKLTFISEREYISEDLHFNVDVLFHSRSIAVSEDVGYFYFENQVAITRKYDPGRAARTVGFYHSMRRRLREYGIWEQAQIRLDRSYLMRLRVALRLVTLSDLKIGQKLRQIRALLDEEVTREALGRYPIRNYVPAMRLLAYLMKYRCVWGVYLLMRLREGIGRRGHMKRLLKMAGIGR